MKKEYVQYVLATFMRTENFDQLVGIEWIFDNDYQDTARKIIAAAFNRHDIVVKPELYDDDFHEIFMQIVEGRGIGYEGDEFTEQWFRFIPHKKNQIIDGILQANPVTARIHNLGTAGPVALTRALSKIVSGDDPINRHGKDDFEAIDASEQDINIPASDRLVTLNHNQIRSFDEPTTEIITAVERENAIPDHPDLRELIIGHLKAGRELVRTGVFKAELLYMTLVIGLKMLVERYREHAIGALASKLLDLILTEIGIG